MSTKEKLSKQVRVTVQMHIMHVNAGVTYLIIDYNKYI